VTPWPWRAGTTKIDQAVKNGKVDARRAAELERKLPDLAKQFVNREPRNREWSAGR
jgi:hypothetical protein